VAKRRERGTGSIYLPNDPKNPGQKLKTFWIAYYVNGRRKHESSKSRKKSDAQALLKRRMGEHALGLEVGDDARRLTFEDLARIVEEDYRLQGRRSLNRLQLSLRHLREHFGDDRAVSITADRLTAYANARRDEGAALASISAELAALRRAFNLAVRAGRLQSRPPFPTLRLSNRRQGFFEEDDFRAVLAELPEHLKPLMTVGFLTGWRVRDELCPMTWDRVDLKAGTMRLERSKNDTPRVFPINADPELAEVLQRQRKYTDEVQRRTGQIIPLVFHNEGRPIVNYYKAWHAACRRAAVLKDADGKPVERDGKAVIARPQLLGRIPHDFRRSACRRLIQGGIPEQIAMRLTGWKSRQMLDRYFVFNESDLSAAVSKIASLRTKAPAKQRAAKIRAEA
jgi:integrase